MEFILPFALAAADGGLIRLMASLSCSWFSDGNGIKKAPVDVTSRNDL